MNTSKTELLQLKQKIEKGKQKLSELIGQKKNYLEHLKTEYKCNSVEEAKTLLEKYQKESQDLEDKIEKGLSKLEKTFPQLFQ